jgi:aminomethyltransferase
LIEFGGWEMPVQYTGIVEEHRAVRAAAGLFDISHMGEVRVVGSAARDFLNQVLTNDLRKLRVGLGQYTLMCRENGGVVDDLYVFSLAPEEYLLIINASRIDADLAWLEKQKSNQPTGAGVILENRSDDFGAVAVQGPRVAEFIDRCLEGPAEGGMTAAQATDLRKNEIARFQVAKAWAWISRTGYTGEDGFEIVAPAGRIEAVWRTVLAAGQTAGLVPAGLGARDTLRTEMGYPLYGHELDEQTTPLEAGLGRYVSWEKPGFTGRDAMLSQRQNGVPKQCVAFKMAPKSAPPRPAYPIWSPGSADAPLGVVTSGTQSPSLGVGIGLGYVPPSSSAPGTALEIEIRGRRAAATVTAKPVYRKL